ncbi:hypothetical protein [Spirochaeta cellobiosiphila]|uniref:hypothetical protein n=1 Tax=Spirochaeta cellobiosiphila TaxID=504483 RepID=UPI000404CBCA|nr:hypothetical protein [Spirochaeta cellobiosiphila]
MNSVSISNIVPIRQIPKPFISVAIDASQIIGGYWWEGAKKTKKGLGAKRVDPIDLSNPDLIKAAQLLSLNYLRIGGTEADKMWYAIKKKGKKLPHGYDYLLTKKRWKEIATFADKVGAKMMITLNAGSGPRKKKKKWGRKNARQLIQYAKDMSHEADVWELGNEVNAFLFFHGFGGYISPERYAKDMSKLTKTLHKTSRGSSAGPAVAVWPIIGEVLPFLKSFLKQTKQDVDIITWHYYPQQSSRSPVAIRRARPRTMLRPRALNEFIRQAKHISKLKQKYSPNSKIWLGETGHAQCGGEPGLSDTFLSGFWWLDQLGAAAVYDQEQVVRQTLVGGDYGLLSYTDFTPRPDYWITLLWQHLMGTTVYQLQKQGSPKLRVYLHSLTQETGYCLCFINIDTKNSIKIEDYPEQTMPSQIFLFTSSELTSPTIYLNGEELKNLPQSVEELKGRSLSQLNNIIIPPASYGFITFTKEI